MAEIAKVSGKTFERAPVCSSAAIYAGVELVREFSDLISKRDPIQWTKVSHAGEMFIGAIAFAALDGVLVGKNQQFQNRVERFLGRIEMQGMGALLARAIATKIETGTTDWRYLTSLFALVDEGLALTVNRKGEARKAMPSATALREGTALTTGLICGYAASDLWRVGDYIGAILLSTVATANMGEAWANAPRFETMLPLQLLKNLDQVHARFLHELKKSQTAYNRAHYQIRGVVSFSDEISERGSQLAEIQEKTTAFGRIMDRLHTIVSQTEGVVPLRLLETEFSREFSNEWDKALKRAVIISHLMTFVREFRERIMLRRQAITSGRSRTEAQGPWQPDARTQRNGSARSK
ncbi:MAG: hypothetical protein ABIJ85_01495 [bacterium]